MLMERKVGIIGAMDVELNALRSKLEGAKAVGRGALAFTEGVLNSVSVVLAKSGVGKVNAALCAQRIISEFGVTHVINTGIAGAAQSGLGALDFVVSTDALYHDMDATVFGYKPTKIPGQDVSDFKADGAMIRAAREAFASLPEAADHRLVCGRVASGDRFISSREAKERIRSICDPACVDMEGAAIAHACFLNKVPFVIIRCMSDAADDGAESAYRFNEETAARLSASLVLAMLGRF